MIRKLGKKGEKDILLENFIGSVIGILALVMIFGYGIYKVYGIFISQEAKNAQNTLERISAKLDVLEEGKQTSFPVQGFRGAKDWFLIGWNETDATRPDKCYFGSCLCICHIDRGSGVAAMCQVKGICNKVNYESMVVEGISDAKDPSLKTFLQSSSFTLPESIAELNMEVRRLNSNVVMARISYNQPIQALLDHINKITPKGDK